jgi:hypothetical protein
MDSKSIEGQCNYNINYFNQNISFIAKLNHFINYFDKINFNLNKHF